MRRPQSIDANDASALAAARVGDVIRVAPSDPRVWELKTALAARGLHLVISTDLAYVDRAPEPLPHNLVVRDLTQTFVFKGAPCGACGERRATMFVAVAVQPEPDAQPVLVSVGRRSISVAVCPAPNCGAHARARLEEAARRMFPA